MPTTTWDNDIMLEIYGFRCMECRDFMKSKQKEIHTKLTGHVNIIPVRQVFE